MQQVISAALFLVVLLRGAFVAGKHYPDGKSIQVSRDDRNAMVAAGVARDANAQEIQEFQGVEGVASDETSASIQAAQTELETLEGKCGEAQALVDGLVGQRVDLEAEIVSLAEKRDAVAGEVAALEAKKAKGVKAPA